MSDSPRFIGLPHTPLGQWSVRLAFAFLALFALWLLYVGSTPKERPTFFSDPLHAVLILGAAAAAIAGAFAGVLAFVMRRERSILIALSVLLGAYVLFWTVAEAFGH